MLAMQIRFRERYQQTSTVNTVTPPTSINVNINIYVTFSKRSSNVLVPHKYKITTDVIDFEKASIGCVQNLCYFKTHILFFNNYAEEQFSIYNLVTKDDKTKELIKFEFMIFKNFIFFKDSDYILKKTIFKIAQ